MSGGSYNYTCWRVEEEYVGRMYDAEMDDMMKDLSDVLHDLEWWQSYDISEEDYRKTLRRFKEKWLGGSRDDRLKEIVEKKCSALKAELLEVIGG